MSEHPPELVEKMDLTRVFNSLDASIGSDPKVQWAARKALAALKRLKLELDIDNAARDADRARKTVQRQERLAAELRKLRTARD